MVVEELSKEAEACNARIMNVRDVLFGETLGNEFRAELTLLGQAGEGVKALRETNRLLLDAVVKDHTMATVVLAQLSAKPRHGMSIYMALELAHLCLVMPSSHEAKDQWVKDISRRLDNPFAIVLMCLESLIHSLNDEDRLSK